MASRSRPLILLLVWTIVDIVRDGRVYYIEHNLKLEDKREEDCKIATKTLEQASLFMTIVARCTKHRQLRQLITTSKYHTSDKVNGESAEIGRPMPRSRPTGASVRAVTHSLARAPFVLIFRIFQLSV